MTFIIRDARSEDMDGVLLLIKELASFEKEPDAVKIDADTLREYGLGEHPLFKCFVAEENNQIIGLAIVYHRFSTWAGKSLHLEDLIVSHSHRGKGAGKELYQKVMRHAYDTQTKRVEWVVLDWNKDAIEFYKKSGVTFLKDWHLVQMNEDALATYVKNI